MMTQNAPGKDFLKNGAGETVASRPNESKTRIHCFILTKFHKQNTLDLTDRDHF